MVNIENNQNTSSKGKSSISNSSKQIKKEKKK